MTTTKLFSYCEKYLPYTLSFYLTLFFQDNKCFIHCIAAALYGDQNVIHPNRVSHYQQYEDRFDMTWIEMHMQLKDIPKFERQNDVSVSVYLRRKK